jgi:hypothetical protein
MDLQRPDFSAGPLGLPRTCWRDLWFVDPFAEEPEPLQAVRLILPDPRPVTLYTKNRGGTLRKLGGAPRRHVPLLDFLQRQSDAQTVAEKRQDHDAAEAAQRRANDALWASAVAWVAHEARSTRVPERRFILGRLIEAFHANLLFPERGLAMMKAIQGDFVRKRHVSEAATLARIRKVIQSEFKRLRDGGKGASEAVDNV